MKTLRTFAAAVAMALILVPVGQATAHESSYSPLGWNFAPGTPGIEQVGEIRHVANIGDDLGWSGSDIEFAHREVTKLSNGATGDPVCQTDASGNCLTDANGQIIYQTEFRDFAVVGGLTQPARIIDITDPENPVWVGQTTCAINQNDIQIQGDLLLVAADGTGRCTKPDGTNQAFMGTAVLDFSDPRKPTYLSRLQYARGSHNHTFVPGKPIVYLSDSDLASTGLGNIPIWDVSDPANPVMKAEFKHLAHSPHDITFNDAGTRAYVAAVSATYILNTEDPFAPTLVSTIPNEGISISHQADPTPDGRFLMVTDELGGGGATTPSPGGPVHVYDISVEQHPQKVGAIGADTTGVNGVSTAHVLRINPDGTTMAIAWYNDGVWVFDFSAQYGATAAGAGTITGLGARTIAGMKMPGADTWAAKMWMERHPGYVFANDIARGFDVFYVPELGQPGYLTTATIHGNNPGSAVVGGATELEFAATCNPNPRSQGLDGWVVKLPAGSDDGTHRLNLNAQSIANTAPFDLDIWFYDEGCSLINEQHESGDIINEGAKYAVVDLFTGANVRATITVL